jgi:hypothetical protein
VGVLDLGWGTGKRMSRYVYGHSLCRHPTPDPGVCLVRSLVESLSRVPLGNSAVGSDILGDAYEYLIGKFADIARNQTLISAGRGRPQSRTSGWKCGDRFAQPGGTVYPADARPLCATQETPSIQPRGF